MADSVEFIMLTDGSSVRQMSLEAFWQSEREALRRVEELIKKRWIDLAIDVLSRNGIKRSLCVKLAERIITKGEKVMLNADMDAPSLEQLYELYDFYHEIESYQCLLVAAPSSRIARPGQQPDYQTDLTARMQEMMSFCERAFPPEYYDKARVDRTARFCAVQSVQELEQEISQFFANQNGIRAKIALNALVVFSGHGLNSNENGFLRVDAPNSTVTLDYLNDFVRIRWLEATRLMPKELPARVTIVYAQCWGHRFDGSINGSERFRVVALSTDDDPRTCSHLQSNGEWSHADLERHAEEALRPEILETEQRRQHTRNVVDGEFIDLDRARAADAGGGALRDSTEGAVGGFEAEPTSSTTLDLNGNGLPSV